MTPATELAYDAVTVGSLPDGAPRYFAYVNGLYANYGAVCDRFPGALVMGIDVLGTAWEQAAIVDWEQGDVQKAPTLRTFVAGRNEFRPHSAAVYCNRSSIDTVEDILNGLWHVLFVSTLDGTDLTGTRTAKGNLIVATQYHGGPDAPYDTSTVLASWR
jgi:hypothetical protein